MAVGFVKFGRPRRTARRRSLAERIDDLLPQTQCGQCGYPGCRPYADAIAAGEAEINQCPPGGEAGIRVLARLLGRTPLPLNPVHGTPKPRAVARIDESTCIGCTLCIQACPVDAIVGAAKLMHTVIAAECTGCELCLPPCPVDCIELRPAPTDHWRLEGWKAISPQMQARRRTDLARRRHQARTIRLAAEAAALAERRARRHAPPQPTEPAAPSADPRQAVIRAAVERARARKAGLRAHQANEKP
ncbi:hypothetical protein BJI67_12715 [Acidihalobacter aeolianus]|uniref:Ion-translocating oxidoreductase complex subunit B n=1 Tax=Acidihalobacter aeolianus TaxID=2792603 RepID=A0A1D8KCF5_9GAMM|nr:hypothetical protein BJI67_12715 [Acidihalobacter aeolianus]